MDTKPITQNWLNKLRSAASEAAWNRLCDEIKAEYGGYPIDWYQRVVMGGVMASAQATWHQ